jgi:predicted AAA+ superfamily ATPase
MNKNKVLESGPFERLFSSTALAKIVDFIISSQEYDYSETEIAKYSGVSVRTVQREIPKLLATRLIKQVRTVGNTKTYQLDKLNKSKNKNKIGTGYLIDKLALALSTEDIQHKLIDASK